MSPIKSAAIPLTLSIIGLAIYCGFKYFPSSIGHETHDHITKPQYNQSPTEIAHLLFGLVGSEVACHHRKAYMESWWRPSGTFRGYLFLDEPPSADLLPWSSASPPYRISDNLTEFVKETNAIAPVMIRVVHAIAEIIREFPDQEGFRWLIVGNDDTIFFVDNILDVLSKYDHTKYYYLGGEAESVLSNFMYSFNMGFGGAGYIFSYPLAKALAKDMEGCLRRYTHLYSADLIIMGCVADIGVNLTPQKGMHQVLFHSLIHCTFMLDRLLVELRQQFN